MKIQKDPYVVLEKEQVAKSLLSDKIKEVLSEYDDALKDLLSLAEDKSLKSSQLKGFKDAVEQMGGIAIEMIEEEFLSKREAHKRREEDAEKKQQRNIQSKEILEKSERSIDYLLECRMKLKEERKHKIESGEIKPPVKKKLTTKIRELLSRVAGMMPHPLKDDSEKIEATEKAVKRFLMELKKIWGINKIKQVQEGIEEKFDKLREAAERKEEKQDEKEKKAA